ncbi:glycoside hydrolase family 16 protein [Robiginitalea sp. IMCC44478]|uniref:glycoside hydrolase family 16 protein n=1 Tax=Robiginitalea sp. IMCC44478 TaxID=3459122 RepID=UPI004042C830
MPNLRKLKLSFSLLLILMGCQKGSSEATEDLAPLNLEVSANISSDGSGLVTFTVTAQNAERFDFYFSDGTTAVSYGEPVLKQFTTPGRFTYQIRVVAVGVNGQSISKTIPVTIEISMPEPPSDPENPPAGETGGFDTLVWSEEFTVPGPPDSAIWNYNLGDGCPNLCGWGNGESQVYTSDAQNVVVQEGILRINAIRNGNSFTSARITSKGKAEFRYGRIEIRAKLPSGGGTWPALWMLGSDIDTNPWPGSGEIDIMEHVGNKQDVVQGATHDPLNYGGNARVVSTVEEGVSEDFHVYGIIWDESEITFFIDDRNYGTLSNGNNRPFNKPYYFLLNIAMGGNLGGAIDPNFTSATMEVDYIRVYQ